MANSWTRLTRENAHAVLGKLSDRKDAVLFTRETTEVTTRALPFYTRFQIYRLVNYATMPVFTLLYLSDGEEFIPLDGSSAPLYDVNARDPIHLNEMNVIPYLEFFFSNVHGADGEVALIKDPHKAPFLEMLSPEQKERIASTFHPLRVGRDAATGNYKVTGTLLYGGAIVSAAIAVTPEGNLTFQEQTLLLSGLYFPPDPYGHAWLEG